jgi:magnesium transporter
MFRKRHPPTGAQPGTLVIAADALAPQFRVMRYKPSSLHEQDVGRYSDLSKSLSDDTVSWIDVQGLGDEVALRSIASQFHMHPLALEDVVNVPQRPKLERFDDQLLIILRMTRPPKGRRFDSEQISIVVGPNYVITLQEKYGDVFNPVRARIRQGGPIFRSSGTAYLVYALLDAVIDGYYPLLESYGHSMDELEETITTNPQPAALTQLHRLRKDFSSMRRAIWPVREVISELARDETPLITERARQHLRDCQDHCVQIIDVVEIFREMASSLMDLHLSTLANKQNEVMKTLTIMASVFIPLTFIAGIYGMNFENMPELGVAWAYPAVLGLMAFLGALMMALFWFNGWLGGAKKEE